MPQLVDVNTNYGLNTKPILLNTIDSVNVGLLNLLKTPIGSRRFQPEYGTNLEYYLQEPMDDQTAYLLETHIFSAIPRWMPRIELDLTQTRVSIDQSLPGYQIVLAYKIIDTGTYSTYTVNVKV